MRLIVARCEVVYTGRLTATLPESTRETTRWRDLHRGRAAVKREFGRLKNEYSLAPLRVRGLERVSTGTEPFAGPP